MKPPRRDFLTGLAAGTILAPHRLDSSLAWAGTNYGELVTGRNNKLLGDYPLRFAVARLGISEQFRNGALDAAYAESGEHKMRYAIQPRPRKQA